MLLQALVAGGVMWNVLLRVVQVGERSRPSRNVPSREGDPGAGHTARFASRSDSGECAGGLWCTPEQYCYSCLHTQYCAANATAHAGAHRGRCAPPSGTKLSPLPFFLPPPPPFSPRYHEWFADPRPSSACARACTADTGELLKQGRAKRARLDAMNVTDWTALLLASLVIGFGVFGELRDALLCEFALKAIARTAPVPRAWRCAFAALNGLRLFVFLPFVLGSVILLVVYRGGSALAVCLNTVAVLFLLEIDNLAFAHGLSEKTRRRAEARGRVPLTAADERLVDAVKLICALAIPAVILGSVEFERDFRLSVNLTGTGHGVNHYTSLLPTDARSRCSRRSRAGARAGGPRGSRAVCGFAVYLCFEVFLDGGVTPGRAPAR